MRHKLKIQEICNINSNIEQRRREFDQLYDGHLASQGFSLIRTAPWYIPSKQWRDFF